MTELASAEPTRFWLFRAYRNRQFRGGHYPDAWALLPVSLEEVRTLLWLLNHAEFRRKGGHRGPSEARMSALRFYRAEAKGEVLDREGGAAPELQSRIQEFFRRAPASGEKPAAVALSHNPFGREHELVLEPRRLVVDPERHHGFYTRSILSLAGNGGGYEGGYYESETFTEESLARQLCDLCLSWTSDGERQMALYQEIRRHLPAVALSLYFEMDDAGRDRARAAHPDLEEAAHSRTRSASEASLGSLLPALEGEFFQESLERLIRWNPVQAAAALATLPPSPRRPVSEEQRDRVVERCPTHELTNLLPHLEGPHFRRALDRLLDWNPRQAVRALQALEPAAERTTSAEQLSRLLGAEEAELRLEGMRILRHLPSADEVQFAAPPPTRSTSR